MSLDLVIRGGRVVFPDGVVRADVAASGGRIAAIGSPGSIAGAGRVIAADGLHVFPGIIDPHVHLQTFQDPFDVNVETETRNAAIGGVTTMIPTLLNREDASVSFLDDYPWAKRAVEERSLIDAGFSAVIGTSKQIEELPRMARERGICSYKFYMAYTEADFALVDLERERVVTPGYMQSAAGWGLYDGWNLEGWPVTTIVRGEVVMRDGRIVGSPSHGTYIARHPA